MPESGQFSNGVFTRPFGWKVTRESATTLTFTPLVDGARSIAYIPLRNAAGSFIVVRATDAETTGFACNLTVAGPAGLHNDHTETANTGYEYRFCTGSTGLQVFATPAGTVINGAKMAALGDGSYTWWSRAISFGRNDSASDLLEFDQVENHYAYRHPHTLTEVLPLGQATTPTAVDLTGWLPATARHVTLLAMALNNSGTDRTVNLRASSSTTGSRYSRTLSTNAPESARTIVPVSFAIQTLSTSVYYDWDQANSGGLTLWVTSFDL